MPIDLSLLLAPSDLGVAAVLAAAYRLLVALGLPDGDGRTSVLAIAVLVVAIRGALVPLVVRQVRLTRRAARARPDLARLAERYRGTRDPESLRRYAQESRRVRAEHGVGGLGLLPLLVQIPVLASLYRVLLAVAGHHSVGAMTPALVASLESGTLAGVRLADTVPGLWHAASGPASGLVAVLGSPAAVPLGALVALVALAAALTYATQRWLVLPNVPAEQLDGPMGGAMRLMPGVSVVGVVAGALVAPAGVLAYWVASSAWTLAQQAAITRWAPTPGSAAYARRTQASGRDG